MHPRMEAQNSAALNLSNAKPVIEKMVPKCLCHPMKACASLRVRINIAGSTGKETKVI
jgi:hypothetical protein